MSLFDERHGEERISTRRRELCEGRAPWTGFRWIWTGVLMILLAGVIAIVSAGDADASAADPGDQAWFLCVAHRPYGVGQVYNEFMVSSTKAQCFVDNSYGNGYPTCPSIYRYEVWYTPAYGGWTGPHRIGRVC
jgi:hypothetical protein